MILPDYLIAERLQKDLKITPLGKNAIQPASLDVHLDDTFLVFDNSQRSHIDVKEPTDSLYKRVVADDDNPLILHPGEFVLGCTLEVVQMPVNLVSQLEGKALCIDTPIPTPDGWKKMSHLKFGDQVFDEHGNVTHIIHAGEVQRNRPCYEVAFSDGSKIIADEQHEWLTSSRYKHRKKDDTGSIVTTKKMKETLMEGEDYRHQISLTNPVQYTAKELPIDPYVLGVWLAGGASAKAEVASADAEIPEEPNRRGMQTLKMATAPYGYSTGVVGHTRNLLIGQYESNASFLSTLKSLGLHGNKHVPADYLLASIEQRYDLLKGLMDTDGSVDAYGRCEFKNSNEQIADSVRELLASLGFKSTKNIHIPKLNGKECTPSYRIRFRPHENVFKREHKQLRHLGDSKYRWRSVRSVVAIKSVPVRCITVSNRSGMFLAGKSYIPTHNSSLGRLGLLIHSTAGFIDPGFEGQITLELSNVANLPITLYPYMPIGQLAFFEMAGNGAQTPYGSGSRTSKYKGQRGPTPSQYWRNFLPEKD